MATPHTRGSTLSKKILRKWVRGYPAYAGIDPTLEIVGRIILGLPRIRGDRPCYIGLSTYSMWATPHTRGSTYVIVDGFHRYTGYPAYAGIDLSARQFHFKPFRLPRIRGDRPTAAYDFFVLLGATPHTRGSTLTRKLLWSPDYGYPAYAGIDLQSPIRCGKSPRLPRIRGDRPAGAG